MFGTFILFANCFDKSVSSKRSYLGSSSNAQSTNFLPFTFRGMTDKLAQASRPETLKFAVFTGQAIWPTWAMP